MVLNFAHVIIFGYICYSVCYKELETGDLMLSRWKQSQVVSIFEIGAIPFAYEMIANIICAYAYCLQIYRTPKYIILHICKLYIHTIILRTNILHILYYTHKIVK